MRLIYDLSSSSTIPFFSFFFFFFFFFVFFPPSSWWPIFTTRSFSCSSSRRRPCWVDHFFVDVFFFNFSFFSFLSVVLFTHTISVITISFLLSFFFCSSFTNGATGHRDGILIYFSLTFLPTFRLSFRPFSIFFSPNSRPHPGGFFISFFQGMSLAFFFFSFDDHILKSNISDDFLVYKQKKKPSFYVELRCEQS